MCGEVPLRFIFHGATKLMLRHVFGQLRNRLFNDFLLTEDIIPTIINGKCYHSIIVQIEKPDFHRLSQNEWPLIIKSMVERTFRARVKYFAEYEKFLNV